MKKKLYFDLEFMRIFACFFVILTHTSYKGYFLFAQREIGSLPFWMYMFVSVFCKFCVPLFFAISGALLLAKDEPISVIWKKRIPKMLLTLIVFSFAYYLVKLYDYDVEFDFLAFLKRLYETDWNYSFWYMYAYIPYLISLPFLRAVVAKLEDKHYWYLFALVVFFRGFLPIIEYLVFQDSVSLNSNANPNWLCTNIFVFPCMGYYLHHKFQMEKDRKIIPWLWVFNIFTILLSCYCTYHRILATGVCTTGSSQVFHKNFDIVNCVTVFLTIKWFFWRFKMPECVIKVINSVAACTFGIYLLHLFILEHADFLWVFWRETLTINHMFAAFGVCFSVLILGYVLTWFLKKIPVVKNLF